MTLVNNTEKNRFEYAVNGAVAIAEYRLEGSSIYINKVETPEELRGTGVAGRLMQEVFDYARQQKLTLVPVCSYAAAWMEKNAPASPPKQGQPGGFKPPKVRF